MKDIPKAFVIAPSQMPDRRQAVRSHLDALGCPYTLFSGLWGMDVALASLRARNDHPYFLLNANRIALALNHWFLWQYIVLSGIPEAIVFEDDVLLPDNFKEVFAESMANTPAGWDMIYLSILFPERIDDGRIGAERVCGNIWRHTGARTWDGGCDGTHAYMVSQAGAQKMTSAPFTLDEPIDRWISFNLLPHLTTYIWHPSPIRQRSQSGEWSSTI